MDIPSSNILAGHLHPLANSRQVFFISTDERGHILDVNHYFHQIFDTVMQPLPGAVISDHIIGEEYESFQQGLISLAMDLTPVLELELHLPSGHQQLLRTRWEITRSRPQTTTDTGNFQWIGINLGQVNMKGEGLPEEISERYKAFELGALGLWRFDYREPIPVNVPEDEIIRRSSHDTFLAECNDTMARMYGYSKAEEMIGATIDQLLVDINDTMRVESLRKFIREGFISSGVETREFDRYGHLKYFLNNMVGIIEDGMLKRVWGTQQDITKQRQAQDQLAFQATLYNTISDAVISSDLDLVVTSWNKRAEEVYGIKAEAILGKVLDDIVHPTYRGSNIKEVIAIINAEGRWEGEVCFTRQTDQEKRTVLASITKLTDETGKATGFVGINKDITDRKKAEEVLQYQATVLDNVTDVIVTTDRNYNITSWNRIAEETTGFTAEETIGRNYRDVIPLDYSPFTRAEVNATLSQSGVWRGESSFINRRGEKKVHLHSISTLHDTEGDMIGMLVVGKDITARKEAEAKLQLSELFYRTLITYTRDGVLIIDDKGVIRFSSPSVEQILGYTTEEVNDTVIFSYAHPDDLVIGEKALVDELNQSPRLKYIRIRVRKKSGEWCWCILRGHNLLNNDIVKGIIVYFFDDTARKQAEDALVESENRFRNLIQDLPLGVMLRNGHKEILISNKAAYDLLGMTEAQIMGAAPDPRRKVYRENGELFPDEEHPVPMAIRTGRPVNEVVMGIYRPQQDDRVWLLVSAEPRFGAEGQLLNIISTYTDITEQKDMARELIEHEIEKQKLITQATIDGQEKERMEIGKELHDNISQHLTTTRLYVEVMREKADEASQEMLSRIHKNISDIINEIRHLSQSLVPPTLGDIGLVESMRDICNSLKVMHRFELEFAHRYFNEENIPDNMKLMFFRIFQEQVNNIIRHADATEIRILLEADAEHIVMFISDNGKGFDPDHHRKGQGLKNIVNRATLFKGRVDIKTAPGKGCALTVHVPLEHHD